MSVFVSVAVDRWISSQGIVCVVILPEPIIKNVLVKKN